MEGLTFGEQVKIMLSRKGMTIKQLAELIEERTGKAMSRQNLTQRLGRDNFQEQDMRMIAAILECPFQLSIFPAEVSDGQTGEDPAVKYANKALRKDKAVKSAGDERDMTIGELYQIHEELKEIEESVKAEAEEDMVSVEDAEPIEETEAASAEAVREEMVQVEAVDTEDAEDTEADVTAEADTEAEHPAEAGEQSMQEYGEEPKKEKHRKGGIFLRRKGEDIREVPEPENEKPVKNPTQRIITPDSEDFQPVIQHNDAKEDLSLGEVNPYTGREYQTNSVRMHPSRIGYVQVYDRKEHKWTDMTEWAFLGYQERKKALLGKDYEPPIYLD